MKTLKNWVGDISNDLKRRKEIFASRSIPVNQLETVCLFLGPYRNLTTLTASILFLHPNCQVLNHAGARVFGDPQIDFLSDYSDEKFKAFARYAVYVSQFGKRGNYGGSITLAHAFDTDHGMRQLFDRSGGKLLKADIKSLVWKESLKTSNHLRTHNVDLELIFARNKQLRFLMPVRNPIDCAISNLNTGHAAFFEGESSASSIEQIIAAILREFVWVQYLRKMHPERYFVYFEYEFGRDTLVDLAIFLGLECTDEWCDLAMAAFKLTGQRAHPPQLVSFYRELVEEKFAQDPDFRQRLLRFADATAAFHL